LAARSWQDGEPSLYGRYDLRFDGVSPPKLLEYNADTPTALFEASVVQWHWLEECRPGSDQFNSIHEALIALWTRWRAQGRLARVHFACMDDDDDILTTAYLQDTAHQSGLDTALMAVTDIGWDGRTFLDTDESRIEALFKLYPWDWLAREPFFAHLPASRMQVLEPAWRVVAASKGILPVLWELFPGHPNLLPASFDPTAIDGPTVLKPLFGREGANVQVSKGEGSFATPGDYADMPTACQAFAPLPSFGGWYPVMGVWMIGGSPHGLGIREDRNLVTGRGARFVPHLIGR
jgi:glutathionylspermidine synthase